MSETLDQFRRWVRKGTAFQYPIALSEVEAARGILAAADRRFCETITTGAKHRWFIVASVKPEEALAGGLEKT